VSCQTLLGNCKDWLPGYVARAGKRNLETVKIGYLEI